MSIAIQTRVAALETIEFPDRRSLPGSARGGGTAQRARVTSSSRPDNIGHGRKPMFALNKASLRSSVPVCTLGSDVIDHSHGPKARSTNRRQARQSAMDGISPPDHTNAPPPLARALEAYSA